MSGESGRAAKPPAPRWLGAVHLVVFILGVGGFHEIRMAWGWPAAIAEGLLFFIALKLLSRIRARYA